jgi:hypothetical protein
VTTSRHHRQARDGVRRVRRADPQRTDQQPAQARSDHERQLVEAEAQRHRGAQLGRRHEVGQDRRAGDVLDGAGPGQQARQHEQHRQRRVARREGDGGERARHGDQRDLVVQQHTPAILPVGEGPTEQRHRDQWDELDRAEQAGEKGRAGLGVDLERERHERRLRPQPGDRGGRAIVRVTAARARGGS